MLLRTKRTLIDKKGNISKMDFQSDITPDTSDLDKFSKLKEYCKLLYIDIKSFHIRSEIEIAFDSDKISSDLKSDLSPLYHNYNISLSSSPTVDWQTSYLFVGNGSCLYECLISYDKLDNLLDVLYKHSEAERFKAFSESVDDEIEVELGEDSGKDINK